jgi:hypothetical protein
VGTSGTTGENRPMLTLTGCVQEGRGFHTYILSNVSGRAAANDRVDEPKGNAPDAALRAYRIGDAEGVDLDTLVGKRVSVSGTLADPGDLAPTSGAESSGTVAGKRNDENDRMYGTGKKTNPPPKGEAADRSAADREGWDRSATAADAGDLPKIDLHSVKAVGDCGATPGR